MTGVALAVSVGTLGSVPMKQLQSVLVPPLSLPRPQPLELVAVAEVAQVLSSPAVLVQLWLVPLRLPLRPSLWQGHHPHLPPLQARPLPPASQPCLLA